VKIPLDECVDRRLARELFGHEVKTVPQAGWAGIANGRLLALAEREFDAFLTVDQNLINQPHLPNYGIAEVVVSPRSNRLQDLLPFVPAILAALPAGKPGLATHVRL